MIRAAFFLIVAVTLGTGESARLLCRTLCDRTVPVEDADACHHNQSADQITLTSDRDCADVGLRATAVIGDKTNRATPAASDEATAVSVSSDPPAATSGRALAATAASLTAGNRPRTVALRI